MKCITFGGMFLCDCLACQGGTDTVGVPNLRLFFQDAKKEVQQFALNRDGAGDRDRLGAVREVIRNNGAYSWVKRS